MKKIIGVLCALLLGLALFLSGCGEKTTNPSDAPAPSAPAGNGEAATPAPVETVVPGDVASDAHISVQMPEGWNKVEGSSVLIQYQKITQSFLVKEENFAATTLDGVVEEALGIYKESFGDVVVTQGPEAITLDGVDARKLTFTCEVSSMDMKYMYVYVFIGERLYTLTFADLANSFDSLLTEYEAILGSVKIK